MSLALVHPAAAFKACQVADTGGLDDQSFNQTAWQGIEDAIDKFGIDGDVRESHAETDYKPNIDAFSAGDCDIIITVGFRLGGATKAAAEANPGQKFSIVDYAFEPALPNVLGQVFATNQAAFLAGYLAAGMTKTGTVGTFGGINFGNPVTDFMDGFVWGVGHYNERKGSSVKVLGWDPTTGEGLFVGNLDSVNDGRAYARKLRDEGADIILPVAGGAVENGAVALARELGADTLKIIGVDADQYLTDAKDRSVYLTSVMKNIDATVIDVIEKAMSGTFEGGVVLGTLANGGVGIAPFHNFESLVPDSLKIELKAIEKELKDGSISMGG
jgi:basic membrane protein A